MKGKILIIDDEVGILDTVSGILEDEGYTTLTAKDAETAIEILDKEDVDLVFLDVWLPKMSGIEAIKKIKEKDFHIPVIMISGHGNVEVAVQAVKLGAFDFLEKPLSMERIILTAERALQFKSLEKENIKLRSSILKKYELVGNSQAMKKIKSQIEMIARGDSRVLILGESGTGKELVARMIHSLSPRANAPFIEVNCAAIPQELIESELFGHEKGAFTGAIDKKIGKFELANEGTLFLDEIGDMSLLTQAKLLRVIETQKFQRVGGTRDITVNVRIISATNKDLTEEIKKGNFREDLYYRLNVVPVYISPLRERKEDIPELVNYFMDEFSREKGWRRKKISDDAMRILKNYDWPGNVRELKNAVERLMIMIPQETIEALDIENTGIIRNRLKEESYFSYTTLREARDAFERDFILKKLKENNWNMTKTAEIIGIERSNLYKKIKSLGITLPKEFSEN
ncbi:sigma-54-dependent transcriptional regulator [Thermodesulfovibrio yellowstonii]|uniref:Nitrogen assimilation regulatory protein NtrX n=2 Tax=Thermodesulfovibrio yellowstonii TaxID=28262 RepID=B5YFY0_THEYD|nr:MULTISPECIES: sigma-54 dependent transcriptional regulator [Thermodesulfovibrio]ACI21905.1 nitrogen assimilation regulatory protein NtrX [Thermodesulfovibrio yellowstonii DSM 11347]GLI53231.1 sigma-54-dependent Fis family transcriptional regulator [Thermodesulfovibrio islandicus]